MTGTSQTHRRCELLLEALLLLTCSRSTCPCRSTALTVFRKVSKTGCMFPLKSRSVGLMHALLLAQKRKVVVVFLVHLGCAQHKV